MKENLYPLQVRFDVCSKSTMRLLIHRDIYSGYFPPPLGEIFCPNLKTGKNLKEDLKKEREKGGKEGQKEKSDKTYVKIPL